MEKRTSQVLISRSRKLEYLIPNPNVQPIKSEKTDYTSDGIRTCVNHKSTKWIRRKPKPSYMTSMKPKQIKRSKNISYLFLCLSSPPNQKLQTLYPNLGFPLSSWLSDPRNPTRRIRYDYPSYSIYVSYAPLPDHNLPLVYFFNFGNFEVKLTDPSSVICCFRLSYEDQSYLLLN